MALTTITGAMLVADLVDVLNGNFTHLDGIAAGGVRKYVATLSAVTGQMTIAHNLGSTEVVVSIWDSTGNQVYADALIFSANAIKVTFETAFSGKVVVMA